MIKMKAIKTAATIPPIAPPDNPWLDAAETSTGSPDALPPPDDVPLAVLPLRDGAAIVPVEVLVERPLLGEDD